MVPHLLSVEDNPETRLLLKHLLKEDYKLTFAPDAEEALRVLKSEAPVDLLLVDINLGFGPSGTDLLREVEAQSDIEDLPAVALTAYAMPGDREELLEKGFDGYVGKPFTREELADTIEQTLSDDQTLYDDQTLSDKESGKQKSSKQKSGKRESAG
ncbi:response regulator [Salinibacter ruber]|uniref:response regulator n=1 Tax=Salinibacter ruber TaxID=146919 RepID=UPI002074A4FB|nr:response regulator [Salinibacter ruber]